MPFGRAPRASGVFADALARADAAGDAVDGRLLRHALIARQLAKADRSAEGTRRWPRSS